MTSSNIACRFCKNNLTKTFADLGESPLANSFLRKEDLEKKEKKFPLKAYVCENCFLVQLQEFETPENIFSQYAYFSSYSNSWLAHCKDYTTKMIHLMSLGKASLVVEIASNDGYLLQFFKQKGIPILGIEPAANVAKVASDKGIPSIVEFFNTSTANVIKDKNGQADLLIANNVLAHVPDINNFVESMKILLKPGGVMTVEFPHLLNLIESNQFDTIYHEHFSYFSFLTVQKIFKRHGLEIFDVEEIPTHGGSLRIYAKHEKDTNHTKTKNVTAVLEKEKRFGLEDISTYTAFNNKVRLLKEEIQKFFVAAKEKKIVCYGAAAKGNTLLNYCEIDSVDYVVDKNPYKQGLYTPGTHLRIEDPKKIKQTRPDYVVILPWNIKEEITSEMAFIQDWGGKFVTLIPEVRIL